jgi:raffinose/stachyose/melibiose transport system permease protein
MVALQAEVALEHGTGRPPRNGGARARSTKKARYQGLLWVAPALAAYGVFVLYPLAQTVRLSFYNWDGFGTKTAAGLSNYARIFTEPELLSSVVHSFILIIFFTVVPVSLGLVAASLIREVRSGLGSTVVRTVLFLPQVVPLVGAAIIWTLMYQPDGLVNQVFRLVGLGALTQDWLGDFNTALPAVGVIGSWVVLGFCTLLLLAGIGKIEPALYEAAKLDGATRLQEFFAVTLPGLRQEIIVCVTMTVIAALASFDIVFVATMGGPGYQTLVPGVEIYILTFSANEVGQASALALLLVVLVLLVVSPIQHFRRAR